MSCSGNCSACASKGGCSEDKVSKRMALIKHKIFVLSGKGGVGKSTVAAGIAVTLAKKGLKVGLLDVDFHGPSQPTIFGAYGMGVSAEDPEGLPPVEVAGIKLFSIGCVMEDPDKAIIWRGPAKIGVLKQLLEEVTWGELDALILDFPPGTGDESLSACQMIPGDKSAVIVTTPQEVSLADCRKCADFCEQVKVPVKGIVENMSGFVCPECGHHHTLFSEGGGKKLADDAKVPLLASLPLDPVFLKECDSGNIAGGLEKSPELAKGFSAIADALIG